MRIAALAFALAGLTGCVPEGGVIPWPGVWDYTDGGVLETTCPDDLYRDPDATFAIEGVSARGFTIVEAERFDCTLDGLTFACPQRRRVEVPVGDTTLTWSVRVDGAFTTARAMSGEQTLSVACTGGLCDLDLILLGVDLPCAYTVAFDATAR